MKAAVKIQAGHILSILRIYPGQNLETEVYNPQQHLWQNSIIRGQNWDSLSPVRLIRTFYLLQWLASLSTVRWELPLHDTQCSETRLDYNSTFPCIINQYVHWLWFSQVPFLGVRNTPVHIPDSFTPAVHLCALRSVNVCGRHTYWGPHQCLVCMLCFCLQDIAL